MRRWGVWIALMLSVGVNLGVLAVVVSSRRAAPAGPPAEIPTAEPSPAAVPEAETGEPGPAETPTPSRPEPSRPQPAQPEPAQPPPTRTQPPDPAVPRPTEPQREEPQPEELQPEEPQRIEPPLGEPAPPPRGPGFEPGGDALRRAEPKLELLADRLRLRGPARQRFLEAQRRFFTEVTARRVELATLRQELRRELTSPVPDRQRIAEILERTGRATAALDGAFAENVLAVRGILGPRQQRAYFRFLGRLREAGEQRRPGQR